MMTPRHKTGRTSFTESLPFYPHTAARCISVAIISAFLQVPAFFSSCTRTAHTFDTHTERQIYIQWTKNPTPDAIDLFFFKLEGAQKLDAYQQITGLEGEARHYGLSGLDANWLVALSGTAGNTSPWAGIGNYGHLCKITYSLEEENPEAPRLVAETGLEQGASRLLSLHLQPMLTQIRIASVSCDFRGRPYAGISFMCNKIYLTYAGTEYKPLGAAGGGHPVSWINAGALDSLASMALPHPEMVMQKGYGAIGSTRISEAKTFCCYANPAGDRQIPRTRLVLEGILAGKQCYYPIEFDSLEPGRVYELDITLRRMGSAHPDIPVESGAVSVESRTLPWQDREPYTVTF